MRGFNALRSIPAKEFVPIYSYLHAESMVTNQWIKKMLLFICMKTGAPT